MTFELTGWTSAFTEFARGVPKGPGGSKELLRHLQDGLGGGEERFRVSEGSLGNSTELLSGTEDCLELHQNGLRTLPHDQPLLWSGLEPLSIDREIRRNDLELCREGREFQLIGFGFWRNGCRLCRSGPDLVPFDLSILPSQRAPQRRDIAVQRNGLPD